MTKSWTEAEVREAALASLELTADQRGTGVLTVHPRRHPDATWHVVYNDGVAWHGRVDSFPGPDGEFLVVDWYRHEGLS